jgi:NarL family two-component system sensor histidine kinase YdfH
MVRARTTLSDARRAIGDLRESPATVSGLTEIIQDEVERFISSTGISCKLILDDVEDIPPEIIENIIRAVREGLLNIAKYAQANEVIVCLRSVDKAIELEISDDGDGFDTEHTVGRSGHYGLLGLRERARILGGDFSIQSTIGFGTTLRIILPIKK